MEKNDLIKFCRYYKGEDVCPSFEDQNIRMLWGYERSWMMEQLQSIRREFLTDLQSEMLDDYLREGLSDFSKNDGVPISLKVILFNRYCKTQQSMSQAVEPFKKFYLKYYS